jgi:hypothetical protein
MNTRRPSAPCRVPIGPAMIRLRIALELDYDVAEPGCDFVFNIHAAHTQRQHVLAEQLHLSQALQPQLEVDPATRNRYLRVQARPGPLKVSYGRPSNCGTTWPNRVTSLRCPSPGCRCTC